LRRALEKNLNGLPGNAKSLTDRFATIIFFI
jgi:hypothetical protein